MKSKELTLDLSVILPVRNEEENIGPLTDELVKELEKSGKSYEIIAINLKGKDDSYEVMKELGKKYDLPNL